MAINTLRSVLVNECVVHTIYGAVPFRLVYEDGKLSQLMLDMGEETITLSTKELLVIGEIYQELEDFGKFPPIIDQIREEVFSLAVGDQKISAIKEYRHITGAGLKDAKDMVEYMMEYGFDTWVKNYGRNLPCK
jgi:hypothetical protein